MKSKGYTGQLNELSTITAYQLRNKIAQPLLLLYFLAYTYQKIFIREKYEIIVSYIVK